MLNSSAVVPDEVVIATEGFNSVREMTLEPLLFANYSKTERCKIDDSNSLQINFGKLIEISGVAFDPSFLGSIKNRGINNSELPFNKIKLISRN